MNSFFKQVIIIILLSILFYYYDITSISTTKCLKKSNIQKQNKIYIILFFHHVVSFFAHFGWLATSRPLLYLFILTNIIIFVHWFTNKDKCTLTTKINKYCNFSDDRLFPDFFWILGLKENPTFNKILHPVYIALVTILAIYKLYYHTNIFR